jgi:integrase
MLVFNPLSARKTTMPVVKLDHFTVQTAHCPKGKAKETLYDKAIKGFVLEVRSTGSKTYSLRYRDDHGRQRQYKIGNAADITFDRARKEAIRVRSRVVVGEDPAEERFVTRRIPTIEELANRYLEYVRSYKRSHAIDERYLRNHVVPKYGRMHLDQLEQAEILDWLSSKVASGYAQATVNRWQVILCHMFKMAKKWGLPGSDRNPLEGVPQKACNNEIERFLTPEETRNLQKAVEESPNPQLKFIVALLLLTGCRKRELLDAKWEEFQLDQRSWRIPMHRAKTKRTRHVPLSQAAMDVLAALPRWEGCPYVVPNPKTLKPFVSVFFCWDRARKAAGLPDCRMHDLRHSAASNMANAGQSLYVIGSVLGHSQTKTTQRYAHLSNSTLLAAVDAGADMMGTNWVRKEPAVPEVASQA